MSYIIGPQARRGAPTTRIEELLRLPEGLR